MRHLLRLAILAGCVPLAVSLLAPSAGGHAFVAAEPEAGSRLGAPPAQVIIRFTEPVHPQLSDATVITPAGTRFTAAATEAQQIRVPLEADERGIYTVEWVSVSAVDGHTVRGSHSFGVGATPEEAENVGTGPAGADLGIAVARAVEYAGLLGAAGMTLVAGLGSRAPRLSWARPPLVPALACALAGGAAVIGGESLAASPEISLGSVSTFLTTPGPGVARLVRLGAELVALAAVVAVTRSSRARGSTTHEDAPERAAFAAAPPLTVAVIALAASGHAAGAHPAWWGTGVGGAHLLAAGLWAGGVLALATLRPAGGWRGPDGRALLGRFSPVAVPAFLLTVATGIVRGTQELASPVDLLATGYGRVLLLKALGVAAMAPLSLLAWRRLVRSLRGEAVLAVCVIGAAALLAAFPLPPGRAGHAVPSDPVGEDPSIPRDGDLTLGGEAGLVVLGGSLRPGEPGRNDVFLHLVPPEGDPAGLPVELVLDGAGVDVEVCGPACRSASVELEGGEELRADVGGEVGGAHVFTIPPLPAPEGEDLIGRTTERMRDLRTHRLTEVLKPPVPALRNTFAFEAPDRMHLIAEGRLEIVAVGETQYRRTLPDGEWERRAELPPFDIPFFSWESFDPVAPRIVGRERTEDAETEVVSFFAGTEDNPIWFRLWVDDEGLTRRTEMRARAHIMDHRYTDFDAPISIEPPPDGGAPEP